MKKIVLVFCICYAFNGYSQRTALHALVNLGTKHASLVANIATRVSGKLGIFTGINVAPVTTSYAYKETYPYNALQNAYKGLYVGATVSFNHILIGVGGEVNQTTKVGDTASIVHQSMKDGAIGVCPRVYLTGTAHKVTFVLSSNIDGRVYDCWGYATVPVTDGIDIGLYASTSAIGIGPMLRFDKTFGSIGCAVGYNPNYHEYGFMLMGQLKKSK